MPRSLYIDMVDDLDQEQKVSGKLADWVKDAHGVRMEFFNEAGESVADVEFMGLQGIEYQRRPPVAPRTAYVLLNPHSLPYTSRNGHFCVLFPEERLKLMGYAGGLNNYRLATEDEVKRGRWIED